ncbi:MAG TPA: rod-binding protein [Chthonomonadaceae bacterium]|nr:rod-binding protein [Chthonomonadaceae bacterium]
MSNDLTGVAGLPNLNQAQDTTQMTEGARQRAKLKKATQDFESVFVGMMLKQMRKSMTGSNALFGNSADAKLYQEMMDDTTAQQLSKTGAFGLAKILYKTMEHMLPADPTPSTPNTANTPNTPPVPGEPNRVQK